MAGRFGCATAGACSLRLSVRTPPFHGGESGSIPLGSATGQRATPRLPQQFLKPPSIGRQGLFQTGTIDRARSQKTRRSPVRAADGVGHPGGWLCSTSMFRARHVLHGREDHAVGFERAVGPGAARLFARCQDRTSVQRRLAAWPFVRRQVRQIAAPFAVPLCGLMTSAVRYNVRSLAVSRVLRTSVRREGMPAW